MLHERRARAIHSHGGSPRFNIIINVNKNRYREIRVWTPYNARGKYILLKEG